MSGHHHHHHHHGCGHSHVNPEDGSARRLLLAFLVIAAFALVEVVGGVLSGSLALIADAGHMVTDAAALALALSAAWLSKRPSTDRYPFGLKRAQVLAAFLNGVGLLVIVGFLIVEAAQRFGEPHAIDAPLMLSVAAVGLLANIVAFVLLHPSSDDNVNVRGALLHVAADIFGSVAAIISALVIMWTGAVIIDAILTIAVCLLILRSAIPLMRETGEILLQRAPEGLAISSVVEAVTASPMVLDAHRVRAWQLVPGETMISLHATIANNANPDEALRSIKEVLREKFDIEDSTVQLETADVVALKGGGSPPSSRAESSLAE